MTHITRDQLEACYVASKDRFINGTDTVEEVVRDVAAHSAMNEQSAENHVRLLGHLLQQNEKRLNATQNATELFLDWLRRDFGEDAYEGALVMIIKSTVKHYSKNPIMLRSCAMAVQRLEIIAEL